MDTSSKMSIVQQKKQAGANGLGTTSSTVKRGEYGSSTRLDTYELV